MIPERFAALKPWIEGKKVLHIGCVQHHHQESSKESWIHRFITENASEAGLLYSRHAGLQAPLAALFPCARTPLKTQSGVWFIRRDRFMQSALLRQY